MSATSLAYFVGDDSRVYESLVAYFDLSSTGSSGFLRMPSSFGTGASFLSGSNVGFANSSGGAFSENSSMLVVGLQNPSAHSIAAYYMLESSADSKLFSYEDPSSSQKIEFYLSSVGRPYAKAYDKIFGTKVLFGDSSVICKTGILAASLIDNQIVQLASIDPSTKAISYSSIPYESSGFDFSNGFWRIGGSGFSGYISDVCLIKNGGIEFTDCLHSFISGCVFDISSVVSTGYISGQTGILHGDVISLSSCSLQITGSSFNFVSGFSGSEFFVSSSSLVDFNNEIFRSFASNSGHLYFTPSGQISPLSSYVCIAQTGSGFFSYDSGYSITYSISNNAITTNSKYRNLFNNLVSSVGLLGTVNSGDWLAIGGYYDDTSFISDALGVLGNASSNCVSFDDLRSGIFCNGVAQNISSAYTQYIDGGVLIINPIEDVVLTGFNAFFNQSGSLDLDDVALGSYLVVSNQYTGNILSGQSLTGMLFDDSRLYFLNGILLRPNFDFSGSALNFTILSGQNLIGSWVKSSGYHIDYIDITGNYSKPTFVPTGSFNKKSCDIWLNGVKLTEGYDYFIGDKVLTFKTNVNVENLSNWIYN